MADKIESIYELDISGYLKNIEKVDQALVDHLGTLSEVAKYDPFKEAARGASDFDKEMLKGVKDAARLETQIAEMKNEIIRLTAAQKDASVKAKDYVAAAKYKTIKDELARVTKELERVNRQLRNVSQNARDSSGWLSRLRGSLVGALGGFAGGGGQGITAVSTILGTINPLLGAMVGLLGGAATAAFNAQSSWQGLTAQMTSASGSAELANQNLSVLEKLALRLPVGLNELSNAFAQLVNRGFKPTKDEISNLSGFAAAQNKSFDQLLQAVLDAEEGELERLKEFGIQARNENGKVIISFKGVTKEFTKGARESASAFAALAKELGSDKLNALKMETLGGKVSNLGDQADRVSRLFGQALLPVFKFVLDVASKLLEVVDDAVTAWLELGDALGGTGDTAREITYPALSRLFGLFKDDGEGGAVKKFVTFLRTNLERILIVLDLAVSQFQYLNGMIEATSKLFSPGKAFGDLKAYREERKRLMEQMEKDLAQTRTNMDNLESAAYRNQVNNLFNRQAQNQDFKYKEGDNKTGPKAPTAADIAKAKAAQKKYQEELLKLENEYGKEKLEALKANELEYIKAKAEYDRLQIEQEKQAYLRIKQAALGQNVSLSQKEAGTFQGRTDLVNAEEEKARAAYYKKQAEDATEAQRDVNAALANEYQKRVQQSQYMYDELIAQARKSGVDITQIEKLEKAKQLATDKIYFEQERDLAEKRNLLELNGAEINVLTAQLSGRKELVLKAEQEVLEIKKRQAGQALALLTSKQSSPGLVEIEQIQEQIRLLKELEAQINGLAKQQADLQENKSFLQKIFPEMKDSEVEEALQAVDLFTSSIKSSVSELYSTLNSLSAQRIAQIDKELGKKQEQYDTELQLSKDGAANNLETAKKELNDLKAAREEALANQKRLQRQQLAVETATQASSLITASTKIISGFSGIPIVGTGLGIAAVALMLGAFAAAKIKAFQLVNQAEQFGDGGDVKGPSHDHGGVIIEAEGGEFVTNKKATKKHRGLLGLINDDNEAGIMDYMLRKLLDGTGVTQSAPEREQEVAYMRSQQDLSLHYDRRQTEELEAIRAELAEVKKNTARIPKKQLVGLGDHKYMEKGENSTEIIELPKPKDAV